MAKWHLVFAVVLFTRHGLQTLDCQRFPKSQQLVETGSQRFPESQQLVERGLHRVDTDATSLAVLAKFLLVLNPEVAFKSTGPAYRTTAETTGRMKRPLASAASKSPPVAKRVPHKVAFGKVAGENRGPNPMEPAIELDDDYFWLRIPYNATDEVVEEVLAFLEEENAYTEESTKSLNQLEKKLLNEIRSRSILAKGDKKSVSTFVSVFVGAVAILVAGTVAALNSEVDPIVVGGSVFAAVLVLLAAFIPKLAASSAAADDAMDDAVASYPVPANDGYEYWNRRGTGGAVQHLRRLRYTSYLGSVILDSREVSRSSFFLQEPGWEPSNCNIDTLATNPSGNMLAYSVDGSGYERFTIRFKDIKTGREFDDQIRGTNGEIVWADDSTVFCVKKGRELWRYELGTEQLEGQLVYEEADEMFGLKIGASTDNTLLLIISYNFECEEARFIPLSAPSTPPTLIRPREKGVRIYSLDSHAPSRSLFFTSTLDGGPLFVASLDTPADWKPIDADMFRAKPSLSLLDTVCFSNFLALFGREDGFTQVWVLPLTANGVEAANSGHRLKFDEDSYKVSLPARGNLFSTGKLRLDYSSPTTPSSLLEYDIATRTYETLDVRPVADYDKSMYKTERIEVVARDGVRVPVTLLWRPDVVGNAMTKDGGGAPCHVYGYAAYGESQDPYFNPFLLPLLDRGVVYAIAHVRGGGEMGYDWHSKLLTKQNSFNDFVDVAQSLVERGIAKKGALSCQGESAGGLLIGSVVNMAPELFVAALVKAPFVDLMATMCDPTCPLTLDEWPEWGNPNEAEFYDYMKSYCPINNVRKGETYPSILATAGLYDPRVGYWEATKWAQVLRSRIANGEDVLLKLNLGGHYPALDTGPGADFFKRDLAFEYAWLLDKLGKGV